MMSSIHRARTSRILPPPIPGHREVLEASFIQRNAENIIALCNRAPRHRHTYLRLCSSRKGHLGINLKEKGEVEGALIITLQMGDHTAFSPKDLSHPRIQR